MVWQNLRPALARAARLAFLTCALAALALSAPPARRLGTEASAQAERFEGQWLVEYRTDEGKTSLTLNYREEKRSAAGRVYRNNWNQTHNVAPESLHGLTREQALSASGTNVRFELRRDAGTFVCEGWFKNGSGSGHFTFVPDPGFAAELGRRGVGTPDARQLFRLAMAEVGLALLDELRSAGYPQPSVEQLVRMGEHGVRADYVRGLKELGYRLGTIESLVRMRDHGVTLEYIGGLREAGFDRLPAETLVRTRDHGVTPSFIREIRAAGFDIPSLEGLIRVRDHGVTPEFIREMRREGYDSLTLEQLIRTRDHGVTVSFIRELRDLGYSHLPVEQLIRLRDHGVSPDFIRRVKSSGNSPTVEELIRMKNRGSY
ncbi:MAG TPA: hypothetical protein VN282_20575 [Pyrinomonadaceae bacterium]|nr:hypothetical protein [Pyrinomonadaceae bacterium]